MMGSMGTVARGRLDAYLAQRRNGRGHDPLVTLIADALADDDRTIAALHTERAALQDLLRRAESALAYFGRGCANSTSARCGECEGCQAGALADEIRTLLRARVPA
jgi:hypothetical protein